MNGYFQLVCEENATFLQIIPPIGNGIPVSPHEVSGYLTDRSIFFDKKMLYHFLAEENGDKIMLNQQFCPPVNEGYLLTITPDKMKAIVRFYAPAAGGNRLSAEEFVKDLTLKGIKTGISMDEINRFFSERCYCENLIVASGRPVIQGQDSKIEYFFQTDLKVRPAVKEDGTVDFFNLNTVNHCQKGQVIAQLIPEVPGEDGITIYGEAIKPKEVKRQTLKYGRNISISEDNLKMISDVDGHVMLLDGKVFVSDVLTLENVDTSTGNIEYQGSVQVNGNVCTNFSIQAKGNIIVSGIVEGACLKSGGDIILTRGMNGMNRGVLNAGGNIVAKFLENTNAFAGGIITVESIIHSTVQAGDEVVVSGKRGYITGGMVGAVNSVTAKVLGSAMGADTIIEVGIDPRIKRRVKELQQLTQEVNKVIRSVQPQLTATQQKLAKGVKLSPEQIQYMKSLIGLSQKKQEDLRQYIEEMEQIQINMVKAESAQVVVTGEAYPGTRICIGETSTSIEAIEHYCKFILSEGEIKRTTI